MRPTNNAGGLEAGMTNGQPLVVRAAKKPISTLAQAAGVDQPRNQEKPEAASYERSDVCAVPAASVIVENVVAFEVARALVDKFGGDSLAEMKARYELFLKMARERSAARHRTAFCRGYLPRLLATHRNYAAKQRRRPIAAAAALRRQQPFDVLRQKLDGQSRRRRVKLVQHLGGRLEFAVFKIGQCSRIATQRFRQTPLRPVAKRHTSPRAPRCRPAPPDKHGRS